MSAYLPNHNWCNDEVAIVAIFGMMTKYVGSLANSFALILVDSCSFVLIQYDALSPFPSNYDTLRCRVGRSPAMGSLVSRQGLEPTKETTPPATNHLQAPGAERRQVGTGLTQRLFEEVGWRGLGLHRCRARRDGVGLKAVTGVPPNHPCS